MMPGRILTMQRQVRELGRLRTGFTGPKGPVRSKTWIITSDQRDCLDVAAEIWGGQVERWKPLNSDTEEWRLVTDTDSLDSFLPPGDPLTQANEMWNRGGAVRRCDGLTESKSGKPCLCLAQFGEQWFQRKPTEVCKPYSQLNVMLLQLPDIGVWRHVTKSFYAAGEIAGMVDLIKAQVGTDLMVPIRLRIDHRKKVADGKTTPYPVPVIELRGATAGQVLAGEVPTLAVGAGPQRQAIEAGGSPPAQPDPPVDYRAMARLARDAETIRGLWRTAAKAGHLDEDLKAFLTGRVADFEPPAPASPAEAPPAAEPDSEAEPVEGEVEPNRDAEWMRALTAAGKLGLRTAQVSQLCRENFADPLSCNGFEMAEFARRLEKGEVLSRHRSGCASLDSEQERCNCDPEWTME